MIRKRLAELTNLNDNIGYIRGQIHALQWTQGLAESTPGTRTECGTTKHTAAQVDAEHHVVTGRIYAGGTADDGRDFFNGADEALWWALNR